MSLNSVLYLCRNPCYHPSPSAVFPVFPAITQLPMFPEFPEFLEFPTFTLPFVSQLFQWFQCSLSSLSSLLSPFPLCPSGSSGSCYHSQCSTACSFLCQFEIFRTWVSQNIYSEITPDTPWCRGWMKVDDNIRGLNAFLMPFLNISWTKGPLVLIFLVAIYWFSSVAILAANFSISPNCFKASESSELWGFLKAAWNTFIFDPIFYYMWHILDRDKKKNWNVVSKQIYSLFSLFSYFDL